MSTAFAGGSAYLDRYGDRRGCGDEIYLDQYDRSRRIVSLLGGASLLEQLDDDEQFDSDRASLQALEQGWDDELTSH